MNLKKVYILQEIIPSYRVPVFKRIVDNDNIDLTVFFSCPSNEMKKNNLKSADDLTGLKHIKLPLFYIGRVAYQFSFIKHIFMGKPDVVIMGNEGQLDRLFFLVICRLMGIRFLWFQGGVPYIDEEKIREYTQRGWINRWFGIKNPRRWLVNHADGMIVYSDHAKKYFSSLWFPERRIWVAHNSPDTNSLTKYNEELDKNPDNIIALRKRFAPNNEKIIFLLGRLNQDRKADLLIQAVCEVKKKYPDVVLVIVGDGDQRSYLESLADSTGVSAIFEGAIYNEHELAKYFKACDIFCVPGISSLAIKIAMLFGKPVISADYGLEVHVINNGYNGLVFQKGDINSLVKTLMFLLLEKKQAIKIAKAGQDMILKKVNINSMIENFNRAIFNQPST